MRTCKKCGVSLDDSMFYIEKKSNGATRVRATCKTCMSSQKKGYYNKTRDYWIEKSSARSKSDAVVINRLIRSYGVDLAWFGYQYTKQGGLCLICKNAIEAKPSRSTHIDHDHATGVVRGILCQKCNMGLGHFNDSIDLLTKAAEYLKASRG